MTLTGKRPPNRDPEWQRTELVQDTKALMVQDTKALMVQDTKALMVQDTKALMVQDTKALMVQDTKALMVQDTKTHGSFATRVCSLLDLQQVLTRSG